MLMLAKLGSLRTQVVTLGNRSGCYARAVVERPVLPEYGYAVGAMTSRPTVVTLSRS
jgi:hypothetical protein